MLPLLLLLLMMNSDESDWFRRSLVASLWLVVVVVLDASFWLVDVVMVVGWLFVQCESYALIIMLFDVNDDVKINGQRSPFVRRLPLLLSPTSLFLS